MKKGQLLVPTYVSKFQPEINSGDILVFVEDVAAREHLDVKTIKCLNTRTGKILETWSDFVEKKVE